MARRLLLSVMLLPAIACAGYEVPSIDNPVSSPPSLSGTVIKISGNIVIVASGGTEVSVLTNRQTHIFTFYGGLVLLDEICSDAGIEVWYARPEDNARIAPAASIRLPATC
ncbi:MAG: hypothetical protein QNJ85_02910 [Gammaproteobacteria bacterium]|nr:hypothetical protein [Gammaproteobacteria bacterium]